MIFVGVWSLLPPPIWKSENEHGPHVFQLASAAAIFIGWYVVSTTPRWLPTMSVNSVAGMSTMTASFAERPNTSGLLRRRRCQADTPSMRAAAVTNDASRTWMYAQMKTVLVITAQMSVSWARPFDGLIV